MKNQFSICNSLLGRISHSALPNKCNLENATSFALFFNNKVDSIISSLPSVNFSSEPPNQVSDCHFHEFFVPSRSALVKLLKACNSSSSIDPIPLPLFKLIDEYIVDHLWEFIRESFATSSVPTSMKKAFVKPLLKRDNLDVDNLSNFRPISQLPLFSKVLERVVAGQISNFFDSHSILDNFQSAYTTHKSTETALTCITNDILSSDKGTLLILLDMSAAFDTINHKLLISRLSSTGIYGDALNWFASYLSCRSYSVCIEDSRSPNFQLIHGVPQGSVLGPILFNVYLAPLFKIFRRFPLIKYHSYADDIQFYIPSNSSSDPSSLDLLDKCFSELSFWFNKNSLKINKSKTQAIFIDPKTKIPFAPSHCIVLSGSSIPLSQSVVNLGVNFDSSFNLMSFINKKISSASYQL